MSPTAHLTPTTNSRRLCCARRRASSTATASRWTSTNQTKPGARRQPSSTPIPEAGCSAQVEWRLRRPARAGAHQTGLRRGDHQLPARTSQPLAGPDPGHRLRRPVPAGPPCDLWHRSRSDRGLGCEHRRAAREPGRHDGSVSRFRHRSVPRPVEPPAGRGRHERSSRRPGVRRTECRGQGDAGRLGTSLAADLDGLRKASPGYWATRDDPPSSSCRAITTKRCRPSNLWPSLNACGEPTSQPSS